MSQEPMSHRTAHTAPSFKFHNEHEWPYNSFYDGWWGHDTLPKLNYEDFARSWKNIFMRHCGKMGLPAVIMWMAGDWTWRQILDTVRSTTMNSGENSGR